MLTSDTLKEVYSPLINFVSGFNIRPSTGAIDSHLVLFLSHLLPFASLVLGILPNVHDS